MAMASVIVGTRSGDNPNNNSAVTQLQECVANDDKILLKDKFCIFPKSKPLYDVILSQHQITVSAELSVQSSGVGNKRYRNSIKFSDIVGCECMKGKNDSDRKVYLTIYCYLLKKKPGSKKNARKRWTLTLTVDKGNSYEENLHLAEKWRHVILAVNSQIPIEDPQVLFELPPPRRLLVLVNPFSGPGKALTIFQQRVIPVLAEAGFHFNMVITERQNHAREMVRNMSLTKFYGIVIMSGDGLIYEVINGLMERPDWERAIRIPLAALPGGSGNALSAAINYEAGESLFENMPLHSSFILAKHQVLPMDLVAVDTIKQRIYSFLSVAWGIVADVDIESERYRSLGSARFTFGAVARLVNLRRYKGRLSFLPFEPYVPKNTEQISRQQLHRSATMMEQPGTSQQTQNMARQRTMSATNVPQDLAFMSDTALKHSVSTPEMKDVEEEGSEDEDLLKLSITNGEYEEPPAESRETTDRDTCTGSPSMQTMDLDRPPAEPVPNNVITPSMPHLVPTPLLPPLHEPVPQDWVTVEDSFVWVLASYQTHLGVDTFVTPEAKLDDGVIYLTFIRGNVNRATLLQVLLSLESGSLFSIPCVEVVKVKAFRLEPFEEYGIICVDGEQVDFGPIQGQILPSQASIMGLRPPE